MGKAIKWVSIIFGGLVVLIILALIIVPMFVDLQEYKPEIEKQVAKATGRPFRLGGDLDLSLFPWAGITLSDLHLGNPAGFQEKDFVSVQSFEVRVKLLPLLSKDIQVKRFILDGARIVLEKKKDGTGNWEGLGKPSAEKKDEAAKDAEKPVSEGPTALPIKALAVGEFSVTGSALYLDHATGDRQEISDFSLRLEDVSLTKPVKIALSAKLGEKPLSLEGTLGPVGKDPLKGTIPLKLMLKALDQLDVSLQGNIVEPATRQGFELALEVLPFSPRKVVEGLGQTFPVQTTDPEALSRVGLQAKVQGDPKAVSLSDGSLVLDDSKLTFSLKAKDFSKPDVAFAMDLDQIDVDRYLPPPAEKPAEEKAPEPAPSEKKKTDYAPLRKLVLDGKIHVGKVKAKGATVEDINITVTARDGVIKIDPFNLKLYQGSLDAKATMDVRQETPRNNLTFQMKNVQAGPLVRDFLKKDIIEGVMVSNAAISMSGDDPDKIKSTLNGKGDFVFTDGAIVGIDLPGMVRNVKSTFGLAEKTQERPKTDFSELKAPFTMKNGVVNTPGTSLKSPLIRVLAAGDADLVQETLDFRIEPKFVASLKGQGDAKDRSGLLVPVLVTGTFDDPKFAPDLKGMFQKKLEEGIPKKEDLKGIISGEGTEEGAGESVKEKAEGLIKGLFGQ